MFSVKGWAAPALVSTPVNPTIMSTPLILVLEVLVHAPFTDLSTLLTNNVVFNVDPKCDRGPLKFV